MLKLLCCTRMEYWEQASPISSHTYDHARTANALPMTTPGRLMHYLWQNIGQQHTHCLTPMTFLRGVTDYLTRQLQLIVMICARIVSSVEWTWQRLQCWMCWFSCYIKHLIMVKKKFRLVWGCPSNPAPASGSLNQCLFRWKIMDKRHHFWRCWSFTKI